MQNTAERIQVTKFPPVLADTPQPPLDLYEYMFPIIPKDYSHHYISCPLTSGGALWLKEFLLKNPDATNQNPQLYPDLEYNTGDLIGLNGTFVEKMMAVLIAENILESNTQLTYPHHIGMRSKEVNGKLQNWEEIDFMLFWIAVIGGLNPDQAEAMFKIVKHAINVEIFSNRKLKKATRIPEYKKARTAAAEFIGNIKPHQEQRPTNLLATPDSHSSLGGTTEQALANDLDIPVHYPAINIFNDKLRNTELWSDPVFQFLLFNSVVNPVFAQPLELDRMLQTSVRTDNLDSSAIPLAGLRPAKEIPDYQVIPQAMMRVFLQYQGFQPQE
jgi:hypothetical protein